MILTKILSGKFIMAIFEDAIFEVTIDVIMLLCYYTLRKDSMNATMTNSANAA